MQNEVILWSLTSSKIIVLVAQPISTDGGPPTWAVDKRAELGWAISTGEKGGPPPSVKVAHVCVVLRYKLLPQNHLEFQCYTRKTNQGCARFIYETLRASCFLAAYFMRKSKSSFKAKRQAPPVWRFF